MQCDVLQRPMTPAVAARGEKLMHSYHRSIKKSLNGQEPLPSGLDTQTNKTPFEVNKKRLTEYLEVNDLYDTVFDRKDCLSQLVGQQHHTGSFLRK